MNYAALKASPEILPLSEQFKALYNEYIADITRTVLKVLPAELRDTYLALRPQKPKEQVQLEVPIKKTSSKRNTVHELTEARKNYLNNAENTHVLGQSKITQFYYDNALTPKDLLELPEYAYSNYKLLDLIRKPQKVDFTKSSAVISEMIQKREFWASYMEEYSRQIMATFEQIY